MIFWGILYNAWYDVLYNASILAGQLRDVKLDIPFRFEVKQGDNDYNQGHYEALGTVRLSYSTF